MVTVARTAIGTQGAFVADQDLSVHAARWRGFSPPAPAPAPASVPLPVPVPHCQCRRRCLCDCLCMSESSTSTYRYRYLQHISKRSTLVGNGMKWPCDDFAGETWELQTSVKPLHSYLNDSLLRFHSNLQQTHLDPDSEGEDTSPRGHYCVNPVNPPPRITPLINCYSTAACHGWTKA